MPTFRITNPPPTPELLDPPHIIYIKPILNDNFASNELPTNLLVWHKGEDVTLSADTSATWLHENFLKTFYHPRAVAKMSATGQPRGVVVVHA